MNKFGQSQLIRREAGLSSSERFVSVHPYAMRLAQGTSSLSVVLRTSATVVSDD